MLQHRKDAAMKREKALSHAFSQQVYHPLQSLCFFFFFLNGFIAFMS